MSRLLLVEDNEMNRDMLSRRLERKGYTIEIAGNGEEALKKIRAHGFFLLLEDFVDSKVKYNVTRRKA